jgi:uncharacterized Ntn-hydrolase superfamily protein
MAAALATGLVAGGASAQPTAVAGKPGPLAHTFSIVARDAATGEMGVAVQSHWFSVGSIVTWAEAGVGAVATQSFVDPSYGPKGLELMRGGVAAPEALKRLLAADAQREVRQVAMIDAQGRVDAFTGKLDIADAGHIVGSQFSVQANMMANPKVWPAMADAFAKARGDLDGAGQRDDVGTDRVLAQEAAEDVGIGGGDPAAGEAAEAGVREVIRYRERQPAAAEVEPLDELEAGLGAAGRHGQALFLDDVEPHEAEVADVLLHEVRNVVVADEQDVERHVLAVAHQLVLAATVFQAATRQQVERVVGQAAGLLDRDAQALLAFHGQRSCRRRAARA